MKRKFKIMQHQIEQLKEEISAKDLALVKEHFDHMKVRPIYCLPTVPTSPAHSTVAEESGGGALQYMPLYIAPDTRVLHP